MNDSVLNGSGSAMPSYMDGVGEQQEFGQGMEGDSYPRLAFKSARFRLRQGGEETVLPETELDVVILKDYGAVSRIFYEGGYNPDATDNHPACASADGEAPLPTVPTPQHTDCQNCPQNVVGSSITDDGRKSRACSYFRRVVVLIMGYEDVGPVVTDIRAMSLFGESKPDQNQWSLKMFFARCRKHNAKPFHFVTRLSFDLDSSVPKLFFSPISYAPEALFVDTITPLVNTPEGIQQLEDMTDTSKVRFDGGDGEAMQQRMLADDEEKPAYLEGPKEEAKPEPEPEKEELSPQQKAAITRKRNAERKKAQEAAENKPEPAGPKTDEQLEDVLSEFDF